MKINNITKDTNHIEEEYFVRMMIPSIQKIALPFEMEEEELLKKTISQLDNPKDYQLVVVGAGSLFYIETAINNSMDYLAIEPLIHTFLTKQMLFLTKRIKKIRYIAKDFGEFSKAELGNKKNIYEFIFNIIGYIENPIKQINKYIKSGDILIFNTWNKENKESSTIHDKYFSELNSSAEKNKDIIYNKETTGLCNLDSFDFAQLKYYKNHKRIKNKITDILIIYC